MIRIGVLCLISIILPLLVRELYSYLPLLGRKLLTRAAGLLPPQDRPRYREEWLAEVDHLASEGHHLTAALFACSVALRTPALRCILAPNHSRSSAILLSAAATACMVSLTFMCFMLSSNQAPIPSVALVVDLTPQDLGPLRRNPTYVKAGEDFLLSFATPFVGEDPTLAKVEFSQPCSDSILWTFRTEVDPALGLFISIPAGSLAPGEYEIHIEMVAPGHLEASAVDEIYELLVVQ